MPIKPGDRISLSISPVIALGRFVNCKAHATISRDIGEDVEADLADMSAQLVPLYRRALLAELSELSELQDLVGVPKDSVDWSSVEGLVDYCVRSINGDHEDHEDQEDRTPRTGDRTRTARKKVTSKARKAKGPRRKNRRE